MKSSHSCRLQFFFIFLSCKLIKLVVNVFNGDLNCICRLFWLLFVSLPLY
ncbi:hypothetical protein AtNW77_Chr1g0049961 [Arabidopsis thaliana]